jgi:hypothetical protein
MIDSNNLPNKKANEETLLTLRRHWLVLFRHFLFTLMGATLPIAVYIVLSNQDFIILNNDYFMPIITLVMSMYYLYITLMFFNAFIDYYLDVWIVTTERMINIEQRNLFNRVISEKSLYRMQDITSEVKGFVPTLFNFGTIYIQTAGTEQRFIFKDVPNAPEVTQQILAIVEKYQKDHNQNDRIDANEA